MTASSSICPPVAPIHRLVRSLVRCVDVPPQTRIGASLRTSGGVRPAGVRAVDAGILIIDVELDEVPSSRCVLTLMVGSIARIDLPVRLRSMGAASVEARMDGVPLVMRRRVTVSCQLAQALGVAA